MLEMFHEVLSGMAPRCNLARLERSVLTEVFHCYHEQKKAQTELCKSNKTPDKVYI